MRTDDFSAPPESSARPVSPSPPRLADRGLVATVVERPGSTRSASPVVLAPEPASPVSHVRPLLVGRYKLCEEIAVGGMAAVHFGRILGEGNFTRPVAIKRLHPHLARDPAFVEMFLTEAQLAARITHPNVVAMLDVVRTPESEILLVMEYVAGASLAHLLRAASEQGESVPIATVVAIVLDALAGLHAAHETLDDRGRPLGIVHRDVSPQNILVGVDGRARVLDFGIAKATAQPSSTRTSTGVIKGKLGYMAPEQFNGSLTRASDIYSAAVVLWEALAYRRLFQAETEAALIHRILAGRIDAPSAYRAEVPPALDAIVLRALAVEPHARFKTAEEMAKALREVSAPAAASEVGAWVRHVGGALVRQHTGRASRGAHSSLLSLVPLDEVAVAAVSIPKLPVTDDDEPTLLATPKLAPKPRRLPKRAALALLPLALLLGVVTTRRDPAAPSALSPPATAHTTSTPPIDTSARLEPAPRADATARRAESQAPEPGSESATRPTRTSSAPAPSTRRASSRGSSLRPPDAKIMNALDSRD